MPLATLWHVTLRAVQHWWQDNCLRLAASLAYYTALSLAPLVLLIVGVVGLVLNRQQVAQQLTAQLEGLMGSAGRDLITSILAATSPQGGTLATVVGLVTLFIGATAVFGELQATMNLIWEVQPAPTGGVWAGIWAWLRQRIFSLAIVFALAFLLLVSLVISAALASAAALFQGPEQALLSRLLELAVSLLVLTFLFALLYKYVPDAEIGWRDVWPGGLLTAVLFTMGKTAIGFYLGRGQRRLGLRGSGLDGGAPRVGLLLGPDPILWRRVHACMGDASWRRDAPAARRLWGGAPDQRRSRQRPHPQSVTSAVGAWRSTTTVVQTRRESDCLKTIR